jgi:hypothetical protein
LTRLSCLTGYAIKITSEEIQIMKKINYCKTL